MYPLWEDDWDFIDPNCPYGNLSPSCWDVCDLNIILSNYHALCLEIREGSVLQSGALPRLDNLKSLYNMSQSLTSLDFTSDESHFETPGLLWNKKELFLSFLISIVFKMCFLHSLMHVVSKKEHSNALKTSHLDLCPLSMRYRNSFCSLVSTD